jgi:hypothetical protein
MLQQPEILISEMTHQSGYKLSSLRVTYTSKLRADLETTIKNLRKALAWIPCRHSEDTDPLPQRLQRRAWRVWYNKAPHAIGWSKRHYVFHDWRYAFDFKLMRNHRYVFRITMFHTPQGNNQLDSWFYVCRYFVRS